MNRTAKFSAPITLVFAVLAISAMVYNMLVMQLYRNELFIEKGTFDSVGLIALCGFVVIFLFNVISFVWLLTSYRRQSSIGKVVALVLGTICMIVFIVEKVMVDEIVRQYSSGWDTKGEWIILYSAMTIQLIYGIVVLANLLLEYRLGKHTEPQYLCLRDETVFVMAQIMGIISGSVGLWTNCGFIRRQMHVENLFFLLPFYILILMPYGLTVLYWIIMHLKVHLADWYDEKQWHNVTCAALITLLLLIPGMALLFFASQPLHMLWFPHLLFLIVLLFSTSTLFLFKFTA